MKAAILKNNQQFEIRDISEPQLQPDECRVAIRRAGVCSSDIFRACEQGAYFYPLIMGHELAGEIESCGLEAGQRFKKGDRVAIFPLIPCFKCQACLQKRYAQCSSYDYYGSRRHGGFAEYLNVRSWNLIPLPNEVSFDDAALLEPVSVTVHALNQAGLIKDTTISQPSKRIAIIGAGFLGLIATQILQKCRPDLSISVFDRNQFKLNLAEKLQVTTHHFPTPESWESYINENSSSFDSVIEASGSPMGFSHSLSLARQNTDVLWMGNITDDLVLPKALVSSILRKELRIIGTWNSFFDPGEPNDWTFSINLIRQGLRPSSLVTKTVGLEDLPEVIHQLHAHKKGTLQSQFLKMMVQPNA